VQSPDLLPKKEAFVRDMLERIADKWTLLVIDALEGEKEMRFTRLQERVGGVSQKMLTRTLRQLERDGLVTRRVYATVPPRVDYRLTPLGVTLGESICGLWIWFERNMDKVERARRGYDEKAQGTRRPKLRARPNPYFRAAAGGRSSSSPDNSSSTRSKSLASRKFR
jgi:DNA-binding HxlR family transcriptional regulator